MGKSGRRFVIWLVDDEDVSKCIGGNSGPGEGDVTDLVLCLGRLWVVKPGLPRRDGLRFANFLEPCGGLVDADVDASLLQHIAAARASVSRPEPSVSVVVAFRHLHFQTLLQLQGLSRESTK